MKLVLSLFLLLPIQAYADKTPIFPKECKEQCVSSFGEKLGIAEGGIAAYSNCQPKCVYENPHFVEANFSGIEWQCVEFARRWLMVNRGLTYPSIDIAADLWNKVHHLVNLKTKEEIPLENHVNGSSVKPPKVGDLLVYGKEFMDTGHVAIVAKLDLRKQKIFVVEQNFSNEKWRGNFARALPFVRHQGNVWILDPYLLGWKSTRDR